jgi:hypothetical protein
VATARSIPQPLLLLQGDRDYQVTVANDLDVWLRGLRGHGGVTVVQFPNADHLFLDGTGPPTPADYQKPGHVDPSPRRCGPRNPMTTGAQSRLNLDGIGRVHGRRAGCIWWG